jgi:hypothetical protein
MRDHPDFLATRSNENANILRLSTNYENLHSLELLFLIEAFELYGVGDRIPV